ncbi:MAG: hypothetical protein WBV25_09045 [Methylocella sp.]
MIVCHIAANRRLQKSWKGRFKGQREKRFTLHFEGEKSEIDIETPAGGQLPEVDVSRWDKISSHTELIVTFKRPDYVKVIETFAYLVERR